MKEQGQHTGGDEFMRLYLAHEYRIRGYIRCLVKHYADVDDVLQNAVVVMWKKYRSFESREHFLRWALNITRFEVLKHFEKKRNRLQKLSPKVFSTIEEKAAEIAQKEDRRREALQECIESLRQQDKELLRLRYQMHSPALSVGPLPGLWRPAPGKDRRRRCRKSLRAQSPIGNEYAVNAAELRRRRNSFCWVHRISVAGLLNARGLAGWPDGGN